MEEWTFNLEEIYDLANVSMPLNKEINSPSIELTNPDSRDTMIKRICKSLDIESKELLDENFEFFEDFFRKLIEEHYSTILVLLVIRIDRFKDEWFKMLLKEGYKPIDPVQGYKNFKRDFVPLLVSTFNRLFIWDEAIIQILTANEASDVELKFLKTEL